MWNIIRKSKRSNCPTSAISLQRVEEYFTEKSETNEGKTYVIEAANAEVKEKYQAYNDCVYSDSVVTEFQVKKYMKQLKPGCAPAVDGISPEHVKYGVNTVLPVLLQHLFTVCIQYGVVPESFTKGLLISILKKPNIDPSVRKHYRPLTISVILS